jgi:hypothetical protein
MNLTVAYPLHIAATEKCSSWWPLNSLVSPIACFILYHVAGLVHGATMEWSEYLSLLDTQVSPSLELPLSLAKEVAEWNYSCVWGFIPYQISTVFLLVLTAKYWDTLILAVKWKSLGLNAKLRITHLCEVGMKSCNVKIQINVTLMLENQTEFDFWWHLLWLSHMQTISWYNHKCHVKVNLNIIPFLHWVYWWNLLGDLSLWLYK